MSTVVWSALVLALTLQMAPPVHGAAEKLPVILVPGFLGFRQLGMLGHYWGGWKEALEDDGYTVFEFVPMPVASSRARGEELVKAIAQVKRRTGAERVLVVAHSQGGVDVREALLMGAGHDIGAIATMSSPHGGTEVASVSLAIFPQPLVELTLDAMQRAWQIENDLPFADPDSVYAIGTLTRDAMMQFASRELSSGEHRLASVGASAAESERTVPFYSFAAFAGDNVDESCRGGIWAPPLRTSWLSPPLLFGHAMMQSGGAQSDDGVVPTSSMRHGTFVGCMPGSHHVWTGGERLTAFDHRAFARELVAMLAHAAAGDDAVAQADVRRLEHFAR